MNRIRLGSLVAASGIVLIGSLTLAITGISHHGVRKRMEEYLATGRQIPGLLADPKNEQVVAARHRHQEKLERELDLADALIRRINGRDPLLPDIFPKPPRSHTLYKFAEAYLAAIDGFQSQLHAGRPPNAAEVRAAQADLSDRLESEDETPAPPAYLRSTIPRQAHAPLPIEPRHYAEVTKARQIHCYADRDSFDPILPETFMSAPTAEEIWFAQVALWIQQDVVAAIAELNEEAAAAHGAAACVEQMPVKRIVHLPVFGYLRADGLIHFHVRDAARRRVPSPIPAAWTGRVCDDDFDVVLFGLVVVVDQRDLLQLIDRISKRNLFCCTYASSAAPQDKAEGYLYGTEPAICVSLEFEAYLARDIYAPLMPPAVRALLDVRQPDDSGRWAAAQETRP
jgi:hypothetical protein